MSLFVLKEKKRGCYVLSDSGLRLALKKNLYANQPPVPRTAIDGIEILRDTTKLPLFSPEESSHTFITN